MKIRILTLALLSALLGADAKAQAFPQFNNPTGYVNVHGLSPWDGKGSYEQGFYQYPISQLQATTTDDRTFELRPNVYEYQNAVASGLNNKIDYWTDSPDGGITPGTDGNKWMEAVTYYETTIPDGASNVTFTFTTGADTLDSRYRMLIREPRAFVKLYSPGFASVVYEEKVILIDGDTETISYDIPEFFLGYHLHCGFVLEGRNAADDSWGSMSVTVDNLVLNGIPEPSSIAMIGLVGSGAVFVRRRFMI